MEGCDEEQEPVLPMTAKLSSRVGNGDVPGVDEELELQLYAEGEISTSSSWSTVPGASPVTLGEVRSWAVSSCPWPDINFVADNAASKNSDDRRFLGPSDKDEDDSCVIPFKPIVICWYSSNRVSSSCRRP